MAGANRLARSDLNSGAIGPAAKGQASGGRSLGSGVRWAISAAARRNGSNARKSEASVISPVSANQNGIDSTPIVWESTEARFSEQWHWTNPASPGLGARVTNPIRCPQVE